MATLLLQVAGSALGGLFGPFGAVIGQALGGALGGTVDQAALTALSGPRRFDGPKLNAFPGVTAQIGQPIPKLYGRARIGGQLIWATRFVESTKRTKHRGKFGVTQSVSTEYSYFANAAFGLCEGEIAMVRRVWADGKELDLSTVTMRVYRGTQTQTADPLIIAKEGAHEAPAYRGLAYVVFEMLPVSRYGNRLPQMSFEVVRPVGGLARMIRAVNLIPGATEFGYDTVPVVRLLAEGESANENRRQLSAETDFLASIDALEALCPNLKTVNLVVSWFGDDLRAASCKVRPGIEETTKNTQGATWSVAGVGRAGAKLLTQSGGRPAFGGTPSDAGILRVIDELKARGFKVCLYPFVLMDIAPNNFRPDPWSNMPSQPAYPWRGRITCFPGPGQLSTADGTAAAATQINTFFGTALASHFTISGSTVTYSGPANEWSFRRHILHCAALGKVAGIDHFIIGTELVGLTHVRDSTNSYPAVAALRSLLTQVRALLPTAKLTYAADWTEYGAHVRNGGADIAFPLDPLWADAQLDAIGIDYYPPLADWREGTDHLDFAIATTAQDKAYLASRLTSGEAFDWYYADDAGRLAQDRQPISDGAYNKPWIYRAKDIKAWWSNAHFPRVAGVETAATAFVPQGKPIWLTEIGCAAVDKGANQPNLFPDPKSSESGFPHFSRRNRDDLLQANAVEAIITHVDPAQPGHPAGANPVSSVYGARMIDIDYVAIWAYDARPFPAFPTLGSAWGDAANWLTGHWINGRIEGASLEHVIAAIAVDFGLPTPLFQAVEGFVEGYLIDRTMPARAALQPLMQLFGVTALPDGGTMRFQGRTARIAATLDAGNLVQHEKRALLSRARAEARSLPEALTVNFAETLDDHRLTVLSAGRFDAGSDRRIALDLAATLDPALVQRFADRLLGDLWEGRETVEAVLPARHLALEPGDDILLNHEGRQRRLRIARLGGGLSRRMEAFRIEPFAPDADLPGIDLPSRPEPVTIGPAAFRVLDLPIAGGEPTVLNRLAVKARPWPGPMTVWRAGPSGGYDPVSEVAAPAQFGTTSTGFGPGPVWRWDRQSFVDVVLRDADLVSISEQEALAGGNLFAIGPLGGPYELVSAAGAVLIAPDTWRFSTLLRGLGGTEALASRALGAGATLVLINERIAPLENDLSRAGQAIAYRLSPPGRDHADAMAVSFSAVPGLVALKPYAPVHASARRGASGVTISFLRRTRIDGDNWDLPDVPLGEEREAYEVEIYAGAVLKRRLSASTVSVLYTSSQETADFGTPQTSLSLQIRQLSVAAGTGEALTVTMPVLPG
jgi:hypothetical protein